MESTELENLKNKNTNYGSASHERVLNNELSGTVPLSADTGTLNSSQEHSGVPRLVSPCTPLGPDQQLVEQRGASTGRSPGTRRFIPPNTLCSKSPFWLFVEDLGNSWYWGIIRFNFFKPHKFEITYSRIQKSQTIHICLIFQTMETYLNAISDQLNHTIQELMYMAPVRKLRCPCV